MKIMNIFTRYTVYSSFIFPPSELALMLDSLFMGMVVNKTVTFSLNTTTFPEFYQQESVEAKQVRGVKDVMVVGMRDLMVGRV